MWDSLVTESLGFGVMNFICLQRLCALLEDMFECQDSAVPSISPPHCKLNWCVCYFCCWYFSCLHLCLFIYLWKYILNLFYCGLMFETVWAVLLETLMVLLLTVTCLFEKAISMWVWLCFKRLMMLFFSDQSKCP